MKLQRLQRALLALLLVGVAPGCKFGLDYSGDESGLQREYLPVAGHEDRVLSYLIDPVPDQPRVIFIHGSPGSSTMYADYLRQPVTGVETIAIDRLGYGKSKPHEAIVTFREHAEAIEPLLEERAGIWPILVGHSLGGPIAARIAADYPDRVGGLIIVAGGLNPDLDEPRWYNEIARWRIVNPFLVDFLKISNKEMWACHDQVQELDHLLHQIRCPIWILHGTDDDLVPFETIAHSIRRFEDNAHVYVTVFAGEGHSVTKKRKEEVREVIGYLRQGIQDLLEADS